MRLVYFLICFLWAGIVGGQTFDSTAYKYSEKILEDSISSYLRVLASDEFEGRETGELGQKLAAKKLADFFKSHDIQGGGDSLDYFQRFHLYAPVLGKSQLKINGVSYTDLVDYYSFTPLCDTVIAKAEIVFLGYGIKREGYDNYKGKSVKGKMGVIYRGEPEGEQTEWATDFYLKSRLAKSKGLTGLIVIDQVFERKLPRAKHYMQKNGLSFDLPENTRFPVVHIGDKILQKIYSKADLKLIAKGIEAGDESWDLQSENAIELSYPEKVKHVVAENVIGWIPGNKNPDEYIFLTAHYDHLGIRGEEVYNGADDNGSGTSALLDIARVMKLAEKEQNGLGRSIVFMFVSGEEKGLLGSSYFVENPLFPLNKIVTDLNIDMIGRRDVDHLLNDNKYVYVIGSDKLSSELHKVSELTNKLYCGFEFDYKYNDPDDPMRLYYRSDHYNFAKYNIPVIFYFRGLHEDYHKPTDTADKIEFETVQDIAKLVFLTAWEISNRTQRLVVDTTAE